MTHVTALMTNKIIHEIEYAAKLETKHKIRKQTEISAALSTVDM